MTIEIPSHPRGFDEITVRGAGVFGLAIAFECARRGAKVRVIETARIGAGSSGGHVGALAPHVPENWNPKKAFQLESLLMAQGFWDAVREIGGGDAGYGRVGRIQPLKDEAAIALARARGGQLWCVFGCGGDRDAGKRPLMGASAQRHADWVVVTSDNPRSEDPAHIIHQILLGMIAGETVRAEPDREAAIALALQEAAAQDVVLIAGKGHEDYQETAGVRRPFSDMAQAREALRRRGASTWQ